MQSGGCQHEQVPDTVVILPVPGKGDHPQGVHHTARQDEPQQRPGILVKGRKEHESAPADEEIQCEVQGPPASRPEHRHHGNAEQNDAPLDAEQRDTQLSTHIKQQNGCERPADQQVDGGIVEPAANPLGGGTCGHGVIDAAHQHHQEHADAVKAGGHHLQPRVGPHQQQHCGGCRQRRAQAVAHRVEGFLPHRQHRRLVPLPGDHPAPKPPHLSRCQYRFHRSRLLLVRQILKSSFRYYIIRLYHIFQVVFENFSADITGKKRGCRSILFYDGIQFQKSVCPSRPMSAARKTGSFPWAFWRV